MQHMAYFTPRLGCPGITSSGSLGKLAWSGTSLETAFSVLRRVGPSQKGCSEGLDPPVGLIKHTVNRK